MTVMPMHETQSPTSDVPPLNPTKMALQSKLCISASAFLVRCRTRTFVRGARQGGPTHGQVEIRKGFSALASAICGRSYEAFETPSAVPRLTYGMCFLSRCLNINHVESSFDISGAFCYQLFVCISRVKRHVLVVSAGLSLMLFCSDKALAICLQFPPLSRTHAAVLPLTRQSKLDNP